MTIIFNAVPTPSVTISTPFGDLSGASALTLTCYVDIDPSLAGYVNVSVTWLKGTSPLLGAADRISISSSLLDSQFTSNLTLYSLSTADSTNFTCRAGIIPADSLTSVAASDLGEETIQVIVQGELLVLCTCNTCKICLNHQARYN